MCEVFQNHFLSKTVSLVSEIVCFIALEMIYLYHIYYNWSADEFQPSCYHLCSLCKLLSLSPIISYLNLCLLGSYVTVGNSSIIAEKHGCFQRGTKENSKQWILNFGEVLEGKRKE